MYAFEPHRRRRDEAEPEEAADRVAEQINRDGLAAVPLDLSGVRIHHDDTAVRSIGAVAYTHDLDIVVGNRAGPGDLAHELGHVVADAHHAGPPPVRRRIVPEDVSSEMAGTTMKTTAPAGAVAAGTTVTVVSWANDSDTARVRVPGPPPAETDLPKSILLPVRPVTAGVAPYSAGAAAQAATVRRGEAAIAAEAARPGGPRPGEIPRLEGLQDTREKTLNRRLIQETMLNRFDPLIKLWTDHYNAQFGYTAAAGLDPNLVKAMLFQESQMGTAGEHLMPTPAGPASRKSRFNLGQVIDTSGPALLIMIQEVDAALFAKYKLENLRPDLIAAQNRWDKLTKKATRSAAENAELAALSGLSGPGGSWEDYFWQYRAPGAPAGFATAVQEFFTASVGATTRQLDYEFWIRTAIRWLFEKRKNVSSWSEAVRAYNGSGPKAATYRDEVTARAAAAVKAEKAGKPFTPTGV
ncbi:DUF4157 domain-containing protein [Micromonospora sp. NPDC005806]|uniref:eCIS core domain-containing protein n=1 Tax=Micromonospora sp. NPDC005806 TaxID=3364234 RepID=UPI003686806D